MRVIITQDCNVQQLRKYFVTVAAWLRQHGHKPSYCECYFCKENLSSFPGHTFVGLTITDRGNHPICESCSDRLIEQNENEGGTLLRVYKEMPEKKAEGATQ